MHPRILHYMVFLSVLTGLGSCENYKDCNSPVETSLGIGFYQLVNGAEQDSTLPALTMFGIGRADSLLADSQETDLIYVPLKQDLDSTAFFLQPDSTLGNGDTINLLYTRSLQFVSSGCGFTTYFHIDSVVYTRHYIDSIAIATQKIVTTNATNLKIYY